MKALMRLTLVTLILASLTVPTFAAGESFTPIKWQPGGSSELECVQFCSIVLCASPEICGPKPGGGCGCYNPYSIKMEAAPSN